MSVTPDVPTEVKYGSIGGLFVRFLADGPDAQTKPDQKPLDGEVILTPGIRSVRWPGTTPPRLSMIENVVCPIIQGVLYPPDVVRQSDGTAPSGATPDVWVVASSQPGAQPSTIPWTATFRFNGVATQPKPIPFLVPIDGRVDLTTVAPVDPEPGTIRVVSHAEYLEVVAIRDELRDLPTWVVVTQTEYDAIPVKNPNVLYLVV